MGSHVPPTASLRREHGPILVAMNACVVLYSRKRRQRDTSVKIPENGRLLRIFIGESDRWHHQPLYEAIVLKAREIGMAGATVLRGPMGFGANSHLHTAKILRLSDDLPMVIELVDSEERINSFLPYLDEMVLDGLVTLEDVRVIKYRAGKGPAKP
jgi:PII-like signaling protein